MYLGRYEEGEKVWIPVTTHKFETGNEEPATITGYYLKVGDSFVNAVSLTFEIFNSEIGVYYAEIDTTGFDESNYIVLVEAIINGKECNQMHIFSVREQYGIYAPD